MTRSPSDKAIVLDKVTKRFGDLTAVDDLSLVVEEGELFGLLGPNGAGKTTTINMLCCLLEPTEGQLWVGGHDVQKEPMEVRKLIGVSPQETAVFSYLTGRENVELFGALHGMTKEETKKSTEFLLGKVGLTSDADRKAKQYSGGMKRRISLIMGLVNDPAIAFLDEPSVALDPQSRRAIWDFLKSQKKKKTMILTTHYMEEAEYLCDRVGIIDNGKLIALGSPEELNKKHGVENLEEVFLQLTGRKMREAV
ncbi:MAG: ATP-binding cassette domain-containing protein [Thermoplasmata archaeon]|nr:ATP-binding cassette domain-containing protein [Thermoplasmata archaeon]